MGYYKEIERKSGEVNFATDWYARPYYRDDAEDHQIALRPVAEGAIIELDDGKAVVLAVEIEDTLSNYFKNAEKVGEAATAVMLVLRAAAGEKE